MPKEEWSVEKHGGNRKIPYMIVVVICVAVGAGLFIMTRGGGGENGTVDDSKYGFETGTNGWEAQTWWDSQAITAVARSTDRAKYGSTSLQCTVNLIDNHENNSKGEAWVDMLNNPPAGITAPVNLSSATVSVWVWVPSEAVGNPSDPNSLHVFFKDIDWKSKFGSVRNIGTVVPTGQWTELTVNMSTEVWDYDGGCDLSQVRAVGVKIGAGASTTFNGYIYLDGFDWSITAPTNNPPATPSTPSGTTSGTTGDSYSYSTSATDPDGDQVKYTFDWGDNENTDTAFVASGASASASHSWSSEGTYSVKVQATDNNGATSFWSTVLTVTISSVGADNSKYGFETSTMGWEHQTYTDSQAITAVAQTTAQSKFGFGSLQCTVNLIGNHANNSKGEAWVDMQNNPPSGVSIPVDLSSATVSVWVWMPSEAVGDPSGPNSLQVFFKDTEWKSKFASERYIGTDVPTDQWTAITVNTATEVWEYDSGCDLAQVRAVGVKIGAGASTTFNGYIYLDGFNWSTTVSSKYGFETGAQGWKHQTWSDSQAITAVAHTTTQAKLGFGSLQCTVQLVGDDENKRKGEAYVEDMRVAAAGPTGATAPVDLSNATVSVWMYLPAEAAGDPVPNGIQLFFRDANWKTAYSTWYSIGVDLPTDDWAQVSVNVPTESWPYAENIDFTEIVQVGVKLSAGGGSTATFSGYMYIDEFDW